METCINHFAYQLPFFGNIWTNSSQRIFSLEVVLKLQNEQLKLDKELDPLKQAGLADGSLSFYNEIEWRNLFENTKNVDLLFAYARTWRNNNRVELKCIITGRELGLNN